MDVTDKIISALLKDIKIIDMNIQTKERELHSALVKSRQSIKEGTQTKKKALLQRAYNHTVKTLKNTKKRLNRLIKTPKSPFTKPTS